MSIVRLILKKPIISHFIFFSVLLFGTFALMKMPVEEMPNTPLDFAIVVTMYPGASPQDVERLISIPLEDAIANVQDIDEIRSKSTNGKSVISAKFIENVENFDQRVLDIQTEINKVNDLPDRNEMFGPYVYKIAFGDTVPLLNVMLSSDKIGADEFKDIVENLKRYLSSKVKDIKNIEVAGVADKEVNIYVDNDKLLMYNLSIDDIFMSIMANNFRIPGGNMDITGKKYVVKTIGNLKDIRQVENIVIKNAPGGIRLYLKDVAKVDKSYIKGSVESYLNGKKAASLYVMRKSDGNIVGISDDVKKLVADYFKDRDDIEFSFRSDQGKQVNETISILRNNALLGMLLVAILLFFFIGWRASFLAIIGIPFSFFAAFFFMHFFGYTINSLSLFAMILVCGMLVDDAIVVIENVYRYREEGYNRFEAALKGTKEILLPVLAAILTTIAAFLPLLMLTGMIGKFLSQLPIVITFTLAASLLEAIFVLPVHLYEMKKLYVSKDKNDKKWFTKIVFFYKKALNAALNRRYLSFGCVFLVLIFSIFLASKLKIVLFGKEVSNVLVAKIELAENTPMKKTKEVVKEIEDYALSEIYPKEITSFVSIIGRVIEDYRWITKESVAELRMDLKNYDQDLAQRVKEKLRKKASQIPDIITFQFLAGPSGPPSGKPVDVKVAGKDIKVLEQIGDRIVETARTIPGIVDLRGNAMYKISEMIIVPDMEKLNNAGIALNTLATTVRNFTAGKYSGKFLDDDGRELKIWIRFDENTSFVLDDIRNMPLKSSRGTILRVRDVADIKEIQSIGNIRRFNRMRETRVVANVDYRVTTPYEANNKLKEKLGNIEDEFPGYTLEFKGEKEEQDKAFFDVMIAFLTAVTLIYVILGIQFNSFGQPLIIMVTLPFAFIGVAIGLFISNLPLSLMAVISLVALAGIVVNDSIILVDFINTLSQHKSRREALVEAGSKRLRPIILTTVTTIGGLLPMAIFADGTNKVWQPMAITIIWGIAFATMLTLFVIPVIYAIIDDIRGFFARKFGKPVENGDQ